MPILRIRLEVSLDDLPVMAPIVRRLEVADAQPFDYTEASDGDVTTFSVLPVPALAAVQALLLVASKATTVRLDGQSDAGIQLGPDGLILILDAMMDAATPVAVNVPGAQASTLQGVAGGT